MLEALPEALEAAEYRIKIKPADFKSVGQKVLADFKLFFDRGEPPAHWKLATVNHEGEGSTVWSQEMLLCRVPLHVTSLETYG